jgi:hypothetical protein
VKHDAHVYAYEWHRPMIEQWKACGKVWQAYEAGKMDLDTAIEASHRTGEKMRTQYRRMGYTV